MPDCKPMSFAAAILVASLPVCADVVADWNVTALAATAVPPNSILQSRALAIVSARLPLANKP